MTQHPYLRAYMAGIFAPSLVLLIILAAFIVSRLVLQVPIPIERVIVFPMALVPNLFGLWNILYVWLRPRPHLSIGLHGALLPFLIAPVGAFVGCQFGVLTLGVHGVTWFAAITAPYYLPAPGFLAALAVYYLVWKYIVGSLNQILGIA
jgi:hypothetical protein